MKNQKVIWNKNLMQINRKDDNKNHSTCNYSIKMYKKCFKKKIQKTQEAK